jgi:hypothetical protein
MFGLARKYLKSKLKKKEVMRAVTSFLNFYFWSLVLGIVIFSTLGLQAQEHSLTTEFGSFLGNGQVILTDQANGGSVNKINQSTFTISEHYSYKSKKNLVYSLGIGFNPNSNKGYALDSALNGTNTITTNSSSYLRISILPFWGYQFAFNRWNVYTGMGIPLSLSLDSKSSQITEHYDNKGNPLYSVHASSTNPTVFGISLHLRAAVEVKLVKFITLGLSLRYGIDFYTQHGVSKTDIYELNSNGAVIQTSNTREKISINQLASSSLLPALYLRFIIIQRVAK